VGTALHGKSEITTPREDPTITARIGEKTNTKVFGGPGGDE
jgi:hypothetical protein